MKKITVCEKVNFLKCTRWSR